MSKPETNKTNQQQAVTRRREARNATQGYVTRSHPFVPPIHTAVKPSTSIGGTSLMRSAAGLGCGRNCYQSNSHTITRAPSPSESATKLTSGLKKSCFASVDSGRAVKRTTGRTTGSAGALQATRGEQEGIRHRQVYGLSHLLYTGHMGGITGTAMAVTVGVNLHATRRTATKRATDIVCVLCAVYMSCGELVGSR